MLKMLLDANGGIVLTNDGAAILREIDVAHPAARTVMDLARSQDEEVGDGTTSVIVLAGEMLAAAEPSLRRGLHPTRVIAAYTRALEDALGALDSLAWRVDVSDRAGMLTLLNACVGTKYSHRLGDLVSSLALDAVLTVAQRTAAGAVDADVKRWAKVEKIPGGSVEDSRVLKGVMFEKDVVLPGRMRRSVRAPRVVLLDCPLEYRKGENQATVEMSREEDWAALLKAEEDWVKDVCEKIAAHRPDLVVTEKGLSDLAAHYLAKAGISAIRRLRKTDNNRIARATGATIVSRPEDIREEDVGKGAGLFEVRKIGDEYWTFVVDCDQPKACTVLLRGPSKDVINEIERNLHDAMGVARNVAIDPRVLPGGGATEAAAAATVRRAVDDGRVSGPEAAPQRAMADALEIIPRTLAQNCGASVIRTLAKLRAAHATQDGNAPSTVGIDGATGQVADTKELGIWEPYVVKAQTIKTAVECSKLLLRIDDIVSGIKNRDRAGAQRSGMQVEDHNNVDSEQMLAE